MALPNNGDWVELRFGADLLEANKSEPVYADGHAGQYTVRFTPWVTGFTLVRWEHLNATGSAVGLRTVFGTHIGANSEHQVWSEAGRAAGQFVWRPVVFDYSFVLMSSDRQFLANTRQSDRHAWTVGAVFDECMIAWSKVTDNRVPDQTKVSTLLAELLPVQPDGPVLTSASMDAFLRATAKTKPASPLKKLGIKKLNP